MSQWKRQGRVKGKAVNKVKRRAGKLNQRRLEQPPAMVADGRLPTRTKFPPTQRLLASKASTFTAGVPGIVKSSLLTEYQCVPSHRAMAAISTPPAFINERLRSLLRVNQHASSFL
jgi:hypothetical protein